MRPSTTARRYAEAAFDVAREDGDVDHWLNELRTAAGVLRDPAVASYFRNPETSREEAVATIERMFPGFHRNVLNLLRVLALRHRLHLVPSIYVGFEALDREARSIVDAEVTVARDLDAAEREALASQLGKITHKTVRIQTRVDPTILGGAVIRIGDRLIDASVAGRLQRLRQTLAV